MRSAMSESRPLETVRRLAGGVELFIIKLSSVVRPADGGSEPARARGGPVERLRAWLRTTIVADCH